MNLSKLAEQSNALVAALQAKHATAETALERAKRAYGAAALQAELGQGAGLHAARAALAAAEEAERNAALALNEAARKSELLRRWSLVEQHLETRAEAVTELADALAIVADAWKRATAASEAAVRCAPLPLDDGSLTGGGLRSCVNLELTRLALPFAAEKWPFPAKPIRPLVDRVADANAHALRGALTAQPAQLKESSQDE